MKGLNLKDWEVRGILEGRITMLCRVVKPQPPEDFETPYQNSNGEWIITENKPPHILKDFKLNNPFGSPGTELFGREVWWLNESGSSPVDLFSEYAKKKYHPWKDQAVHWEVNRIKSKSECEQYGWKIKPSSQMPEWASRIRLKTKSVVCKRVQEITEEEAKYLADITRVACRCYSCCNGEHNACLTSEQNWDRQYRDGYADIFNKDHGPGAWATNPWVFLGVVETKKEIRDE